MGYTYAQGLRDTDLTLEQQISIHFSSNCYPPVPQIMVPVAIEAIQSFVVCEDKEISLPKGVSFRGQTKVSPLDVIQSLRLYAWVNEEGY